MRLRQELWEGFEVRVLETGRHTYQDSQRHEAMRTAASEGRAARTVSRGRADVLEEIIRYIHVEMSGDVKQAPYILQAWVDGVYFYYTHGDLSRESLEGTWREQSLGAKEFKSLTEAEAFIMTNFNPDASRDSILIVPLKEVQSY